MVVGDDNLFVRIERVNINMLNRNHNLTILYSTHHSTHQKATKNTSALNMNLSCLLPLALAAVAFAQPDDLCGTKYEELIKCIKTTSTGDEGEGGACMTCLEKETNMVEGETPSPEMIDVAVAACTGSEAPCHVCAAQVGEMADCGKKNLKAMGEEL